MKSLLLALMFATAAAWADTTPNLITNQIGNGLNSTWAGIGGYSQLNGAHPTTLWGCCTSYSGAAPFLDTSTTNGNGESGQIIWSYGQASVAQAITINQILSGTGIQINGFNWSYDLRNMNGVSGGQGGVDQLTAVGRLWNATGQSILLSQSRTHTTQMDWTNFSSTVVAPSPYALADVGYLQVAFTSQDSGFWAGYYGPQIRNVQASLNYTAVPVDPCTVDPLSSPSCPGYATAYHDQQCSINALYATSCPGYQQAYYNQQCTINPLYDSTCPGYQAAYYNQQCTADALYDSGCPGYQQAYYDQQCAANPLYDSGCANYDVVYAATQPPTTEESTTVTAQVDTTTSVTASSEPTAATSATSPTSVSPAAVVSAVKPAPAPAAPAPSSRAQSTESARQETKAAQQRTEQKRTDRAVARAVPPGATGRAAAQAAAERAEEAVAEAAAATSIEAQQAAQSLVLGLMGFNPAFSAYQNAIVPDTNAAVMARQYNQPTVDNRRALRGLSGASDRMHQDMVDQQYGRMP